MADFAVELHHLTKTFTVRDRSDVAAVVDINLQIRPGEFFTILGPSGCGKTTTLRLIAGFERPTSGEIYIQGQPVAHIPPNRRPVNTVFQNYALFPHLNVVQNVGYGLAVKRVRRPERERRVAEALALVRMGGMEDRKPAELSGGQQQRVALARALVNRPAVLLLDEPLGALDLKLRKDMQYELKQLQAKVGITFVYITHDQEEALTMSDRIAVMQAGRVLQVDEPLEIYEKPRTRFVADFIGETNFLRCQVGTTRADQVEVTFAGQVFSLPAVQQLPVSPAFIAVRPEKLVLAAPGEIGLSKNGSVPIAIPAVVDQATFLGTDIRYVVRLKSDEKVAVRVQNTHLHTPGEFLTGSPVRLWCYPEDLRILTE